MYILYAVFSAFWKDFLITLNFLTILSVASFKFCQNITMKHVIQKRVIAHPSNLHTQDMEAEGLEFNANCGCILILWKPDLKVSLIQNN